MRMAGTVLMRKQQQPFDAQLLVPTGGSRMDDRVKSSGRNVAGAVMAGGAMLH